MEGGGANEGGPTLSEEGLVVSVAWGGRAIFFSH